MGSRDDNMAFGKSKKPQGSSEGILDLIYVIWGAGDLAVRHSIKCSELHSMWMELLGCRLVHLQFITSSRPTLSISGGGQRRPLAAVVSPLHLFHRFLGRWR